MPLVAAAVVGGAVEPGHAGEEAGTCNWFVFFGRRWNRMKSVVLVLQEAFERAMSALIVEVKICERLQLYLQGCLDDEEPKSVLTRLATWT